MLLIAERLLKYSLCESQVRLIRESYTIEPSPSCLQVCMSVPCDIFIQDLFKIIWTIRYSLVFIKARKTKVIEFAFFLIRLELLFSDRQ